MLLKSTAPRLTMAAPPCGFIWPTSGVAVCISHQMSAPLLGDCTPASRSNVYVPRSVHVPEEMTGTGVGVGVNVGVGVGVGVSVGVGLGVGVGVSVAVAVGVAVGWVVAVCP